MSSTVSSTPSAVAASSSPDPISVDISAQHAEATTVPIANAADTTLSNALTTPTLASIHDHIKASKDIVISNPEEFARKISQMVKDGADKLQVIADFDRTISAFVTSTGHMCAASHQLLDSCIDAEHQVAFRPAMDTINTKYFALEVSHEITEEQRAVYMLEWCNLSHSLLLQQNIHYHSIEKAVQSARERGQLELRKGAHDLVHMLDKSNIPCLIFSAGLQDTIQVTLKQEKLFDLNCLHLIGNKMVFDEAQNGKLVSFSDDVITPCNKNYSHVRTQQPKFHEQSKERRNVILMGDNIGDTEMATGMDGIGAIIKIGLLHDKVDRRLQQFKDNFDVVLLNDADCSFVNKIVQDIINQSVDKKSQ